MRSGWIRAALWISIAIAVAAVVRRLFALAHPVTSGAPGLVDLDAWFTGHTVLTVAHIVPAMVFVLLLPFVFSRYGENRSLNVAVFSLGGIVGLTAYAMSAYSVGGWAERSAVWFFNTWYLACLAAAFCFRRAGMHVRERRWLTKAVVVLLGIATTRPVMGVFFATSPITHLTPHQFFGWAFWIGFSINTIAVEWWLHSHAPTARQVGVAA